MKNLVLGALLAVASISAGCTSSSSGDDIGDDDGGGGGDTRVSVGVSWSFKHLADGGARSCPTGYGTAVIKAQVVDATSHRGSGTDYTDLYNCSDMAGVSKLPPGHQYLVWVEFTNDAQTNLYAQSEETYVDTGASVDPIDVQILDDGGYFYFSWDLKDATTGALLSCADAGVSSNGSVESISTLVSDKTYFKDDKFTCEDHYGTTFGLKAGAYTISVDAEDNNNPLGSAVNLSGTIKAPNVLTDLGNIVIPID